MNFDEMPARKVRPSMANSFLEQDKESLVIEKVEESKISDKKKILMEKTNKF